MSVIVLYKSKYGASRQYAEWIAEELGCSILDVDKASISEVSEFDTIIVGGGLYANSIAGANFVVKNRDKLKNKKLIFFSVGITPLDCRDYYDRLVVDKTFPDDMKNNIIIFNFLGKMLIDELSLSHKAALKMLKKIMSNKEHPTDMEKMLIDLCDYNKSEISRDQIKELINFVNSLEK